MFDDAVRLCASAKYLNAGTVEFLVDQEGRYSPMQPYNPNPLFNGNKSIERRVPQRGDSGVHSRSGRRVLCDVTATCNNSNDHCCNNRYFNVT